VGVDVVARVVDELAEEDGASGRKRAPGPPEVQGARVAVADALFARRLRVDLLEREGDLDELALGAQAGPPSRARQHSAACVGRVIPAYRGAMTLTGRPCPRAQ